MAEHPKIIKLDAIDSTNRYLKQLPNAKTLGDLIVVVAKNQFGGRGQMGTSWNSDSGKNLTFSILKQFDALSVDRKFEISMAVALALKKVFDDLKIPGVAIKWPNDILSDTSKICGILIENTLNGGTIRQAVIGIGLNVNQEEFENLPRAASLKMVTGKVFDLDELLERLFFSLKQRLVTLEKGSTDDLLKSYQEALFKKDRPSKFQLPSGTHFTGIIRGVTNTGKLVIEPENGSLEHFDFKEVVLDY